MKEVLVYTMHFPEYRVDAEPDHAFVGARVDEFIKTHFLGAHIVLRCLGSVEHPGKSSQELIETIKTLGTDRYDPARQGDRYGNNEGKPIDFFGIDYHVDKDAKMFEIFTWPFYFYRSKFNNDKPVRIDIVTVYDPAKLEQVFFSYKGREAEGLRSDGWLFKDPQNKTAALLGIINITE